MNTKLAPERQEKEKLKASIHPELTKAEIKAIQWPVDCNHGVVSRVTKQLLHASDSKKFIDRVYDQMIDPEYSRHKPYGKSVDIQVVSK